MQIISLIFSAYRLCVDSLHRLLNYGMMKTKAAYAAEAEARRTQESVDKEMANVEKLLSSQHDPDQHIYEQTLCFGQEAILDHMTAPPIERFGGLYPLGPQDCRVAKVLLCGQAPEPEREALEDMARVNQVVVVKVSASPRLMELGGCVAVLHPKRRWPQRERGSSPGGLNHLNSAVLPQSLGTDNPLPAALEHARSNVTQPHHVYRGKGEGKGKGKGRVPCRYHNTPQGCRYGDACWFKH